MQFHEIKPKHLNKRKKRVGRGGKKGTYSGRGIKGQKSRSGSTPRPALRDIIKKIPKKRGYRFNPLKEKPIVLNISIIEKTFQEGEIVDLAALRAKRLIRKTDKNVKFLGKGELSKKITFRGRFKFSKSALAIIEKAGGKLEIKEKARPTLPKAERKKLKKEQKAKKTAAQKNIKDSAAPRKGEKRVVTKGKGRTKKNKATQTKASTKKKPVAKSKVKKEVEKARKTAKGAKEEK